MRQRLSVFCAVALATIYPRLCAASTEGLVSVAQPMYTEDAGIIIGITSYVGYMGWNPALLVLLTCAESATKVSGGSAHGPGSDVENRNLASIAGLTIHHVPKSTSADEPYFGDTLRVVLTIPPNAVAKERADEWRHEVSANLRDIVRATIDCARTNAANQRPPLRYLDVRIEGGTPDLAPLSATYSLAEAPIIPCRQYGFDRAGDLVREIGDPPQGEGR